MVPLLGQRASPTKELAATTAAWLPKICSHSHGVEVSNRPLENLRIHNFSQAGYRPRQPKAAHHAALSLAPQPPHTYLRLVARWTPAARKQRPTYLADELGLDVRSVAHLSSGGVE
jgi:hypothetical protein